MSPWIDNDGDAGGQLEDGDLGEWIWDGYNILIDKNEDGAFTYTMGHDSIIYDIHDVWGNNIEADINIHICPIFIFLKSNIISSFIYN